MARQTEATDAEQIRNIAADADLSEDVREYMSRLGLAVERGVSNANADESDAETLRELADSGEYSDETEVYLRKLAVAIDRGSRHPNFVPAGELA